MSEPETVAWRYDEGGRFVVADETVYLRTQANELHALDAADGTLEWTTDEVVAEGIPAVTDGTVYVGGDRLTALDAHEGTVEWQRACDTGASDSSVSSPTVAYGRVYVVADGTLFAHDSSDGTIDWSCERIEIGDDEADSDGRSFTTEAVAVANESVYALTEDGAAVVALDAETGDPVWTARPDFESSMAGPLTATDTTVYGRYPWSDRPIRFDAETGEREYTHDRIQDGETDGAQVAPHEYNLYAYRCESDGSGYERLWANTYPLQAQWNPILNGDTVIVSDQTQGGPASLIGYDLEDGTERWSYSLEEIESEISAELDLEPSEDAFVASRMDVAVSDERLYVADRALVALQSTGEDSTPEE